MVHSIVVGSAVTISTRYLPGRFDPMVTAKHHSHPPHRSIRSICDLFNASIRCRSIITIAKPLRQHVRQSLRFDVSGDLQATWPNFAAYCPRFFGMHGCRPHHINWRTRDPAGAEAFAGRDASETATEMATTLRHQGSLLRKIVNRLSSSAIAKVTVSQVSRALMRPEPSLICRSWARRGPRGCECPDHHRPSRPPEKDAPKPTGDPEITHGDRRVSSLTIGRHPRPMPGARAMFIPWFALGAGFGGRTPGRSRHTFVVGQSDLMMHYDITVNDDCEIRLSGDQTSLRHTFSV